MPHLHALGTSNPKQFFTRLVAYQQCQRQNKLPLLGTATTQHTVCLLVTAPSIGKHCYSLAGGSSSPCERHIEQLDWCRHRYIYTIQLFAQLFPAVRYILSEYYSLYYTVYWVIGCFCNPLESPIVPIINDTGIAQHYRPKPFSVGFLYILYTQ
jgi:hypothetical protein